MKNLKNAILSAAALAFALSLGACGKSEKGEGPAEKAGDKAKEVAKDAVDKMRDTKK
jgi:predicted small lipoprotein YifL